MYGHYFCPRCLSVCLYVCLWKKINMISARDITGVASHGKHTRATEHVKKFGEQNWTKFSASKIWTPKLPRKRLWQFCRAQIFLAENFVQFCSPIFSHVRWLRVCLPWQCYPKESWFMSITWLIIDEESCSFDIVMRAIYQSVKVTQTFWVKADFSWWCCVMFSDIPFKLCSCIYDVHIVGENVEK